MTGLAVVIGGGANELVAAHCLARSGCRVLVLEPRAAPGDASAEIGWIPPRIVRDLDLERRGLAIDRPEPWAAVALPDGGRLELWNDMARSVEAIRRLSPRDALKGVLGAAGIMHYAKGPRAAGTAFRLLHHHVGSPAGVFRPPRSNIGRVLAALGGIEIRRGASPARIEVRENRVTGVVLASGEQIAASLVVSGADPRRTLLDWVDPGWLDPQFVRALKHLRCRGVVASRFTCNTRPTRSPTASGTRRGATRSAIPSSGCCRRSSGDRWWSEPFFHRAIWKRRKISPKGRRTTPSFRSTRRSGCGRSPAGRVTACRSRACTSAARRPTRAVASRARRA